MPKHPPFQHSFCSPTPGFQSLALADAPGSAYRDFASAQAPAPTEILNLVETLSHVGEDVEFHIAPLSQRLYAYWLRSEHQCFEVLITGLRGWDGPQLLESAVLDAGLLGERHFFPIGEISRARPATIRVRTFGTPSCAPTLNLAVLCTREPIALQDFPRAAALQGTRVPAAAQIRAVVEEMLQAGAAAMSADRADVERTVFHATAAPAQPKITRIHHVDIDVPIAPPAPAATVDAPVTPVERLEGAGSLVPAFVRVRDREAAAVLQPVFPEIGNDFPSADRVAAVLGAPTELRVPGCSEPVRAWIFMSPQAICSLELTEDRRWRVRGAAFAHASSPSPLAADVVVPAHACCLLGRVFQLCVAADTLTRSRSSVTNDWHTPKAVLDQLLGQEPPVQWSPERVPLPPGPHPAGMTAQLQAQAHMAQVQGFQAQLSEAQARGQALGDAHFQQQCADSDRRRAQADLDKLSDYVDPATGARGIWTCTCCGAQMDASPSWRFNGSGWEHMHSDNPQAGYLHAEFIPREVHDLVPPGAG